VWLTYSSWPGISGPGRDLLPDEAYKRPKGYSLISPYKLPKGYSLISPLIAIKDGDVAWSGGTSAWKRCYCDVQCHRKLHNTLTYMFSSNNSSVLQLICSIYDPLFLDAVWATVEIYTLYFNQRNKWLTKLHLHSIQISQLWKMPSSGMLHRVALVTTDVSERTASFIRVKRIDELRTLAVISNWSTLQMS
jgi:hypothetical protein